MARTHDIIVVGAGIIGCAIAHELARRGASVQIVDERATGMGATHASAGMLAPYIEAGPGGPLLDLTVRSLQLFDEFIARVTSESGISVAYQRCGTLQIAFTADEMLELRNTAARLEAQGVSAGIVDAQTARVEEPYLSEDVIGGLVVSTHGFTAPGDLTRALVAAARRHGAQVIEGSAVRRITHGTGELIVETDRGSLSGTAVVLAAGSWSSRVEIEGVTTRTPVRPIRGQLLHLGWKGPVLHRVTWSRGCYLVPWDDGTLLVGATVEDAGFEERTTVAGVRDLLDAACEVVPHAWTAGFLGARAGLRPATSDHLPMIGASSIVPNLMYATGHYRNGVLLAPLTAQRVASEIASYRAGTTSTCL